MPGAVALLAATAVGSVVGARFGKAPFVIAAGATAKLNVTTNLSATGVFSGAGTIIKQGAAALTLGTPQRLLLREVIFFGALPYIVVGLRTAVSISFYTLVAAELAGLPRLAVNMVTTSLNLLSSADCSLVVSVCNAPSA